MPTSIHLPKDLQAMVDRRARALGVSRNRFIVDAIRSVLQSKGDWSPGFIAALESTDDSVCDAVDEMEQGIIKHRRSKGPVKLEPPAQKRRKKSAAR